MSGLNFASAWEQTADNYGDRPALIHGDRTVTWAEFDQRASRLAGALSADGVEPGDNVALALFNDNAYLEAEFAAFKLRSAPCNVNYRYMDSELAYLVDNSDAKAVFFDATLADRFGRVREDLPGVRRWIQVGGAEVPDWADDYEDVVASSEPAARIERSDQDLIILYTGGTTGNPKGVMWPHESLVRLAGRALEPFGLTMPTNLVEMAEFQAMVAPLGIEPRILAASPLMHGTAGLTALSGLLFGGAVITLTNRSFDPDELWATVGSARATNIAVVGDVFCRPMVDALDRAAAAGNPYDLSSLQEILSSGVMWSQPVKERLLGHAKEAGVALRLTDSLGASEGIGFASKSSVADGDTETATFELGPHAAVFTADGRRVEPGSDEIGLLAVTGPIPLGYYGDPEKTAATFPEFEGVRWSIPGDWATLSADGMVTLLGRGSVSINTGGEKVFPEEVEEALKLLPEVADVNVVGVPDDTWGAAVTAVVQLADGAEVDGGSLVDRLRGTLAGYKLPKHVVVVPELVRGPNGKSDYRWAVSTARSALGR